MFMKFLFHNMIFLVNNIRRTSQSGDVDHGLANSFVEIKSQRVNASDFMVHVVFGLCSNYSTLLL